MLRAQVARESGGVSTYLGMHRLSKLPASSHSGNVLYDSAAYLSHLETQLERVTAACEQALDLREETLVVREAVEEITGRVNSLDGHRRENDDRLSNVEALGDRLTALEVEVTRQDEQRQRERERYEERQQQQRNLESNSALLERLAALEKVVVEFQMRGEKDKDQQQSEVARLTARLEASEAVNAELEARCQGVEAAQKEALARLRSEVEQTILMDHHRTLSTFTKQGVLAQEELSRLQQQVTDLQRGQWKQEEEAKFATSWGMGGGATVNGFLEERGEEKPTTKSATATAGKWEQKLSVLTAAFRHAEEGHKRTREEQQAALSRLQQTLLETAARQAEAVLGVVRQLEERLAGLEAKQQLPEDGMWQTAAAMGTTTTACFQDVMEEEEEEQERQEQGGTAARQDEQQQLQEEERDIEEELMRATAAVLAAGAMIGAGGRAETHPAASQLQAPPGEAQPRTEQKEVVRQPRRGKLVAGEDKSSKVVARKKKSLIPYPPPGTSSPSPPLSSLSSTSALRRPQQRREVLGSVAASEERFRFLSWLVSQQGRGKTGSAAAGGGGGGGASEKGKVGSRTTAATMAGRRRSAQEQEQQRQL